MEPVTMAIVAALSAGAASGATDVAKKALVDAYEGLKAMIKKKFGSNSDAADALDKLQAKPESVGRQTTLAEELNTVNAAADQELLRAAHSLLELIKALPQEEQHIVQVAHGQVAQASGVRSTASVTIHSSGGPGKERNE